MEIDAFAFGITDWSQIERTEHCGETGIAYCCGVSPVAAKKLTTDTVSTHISQDETVPLISPGLRNN